jgi:uncharacterized protein DUF1629
MYWYWIIDHDNVHARPFIADLYDLKGMTDRDFRLGEPIHSWDHASWLQGTTHEWDGKPDDVLGTALDLPIYSARLREALERAGIGGIQYLPIRVLRRDGAEILGYSIANILNYVSALVPERSEYLSLGENQPSTKGDAQYLLCAALRRSALRGHHLIRLQEAPTSLYASEYFKRIFETHCFTGYGFSEMVTIVDDVGRTTEEEEAEELGPLAGHQLQLPLDEAPPRPVDEHSPKKA